MEKYVSLAMQLGMNDAKIISSEAVYFDNRAFLKCRWGCEHSKNQTIKCDTRETTLLERQDMFKKYKNILLVHSHDAVELTKALLEIERVAFLDGHYFAFAIRYCNYCSSCNILNGNACPHPDKVRPCEQLFGIDVFKTVKELGYSIKVLTKKDEIQNRYGFVLIN
ncbi:MAG: metal-binding protein [Candidatus Lokiarchaeota archaeon]|nr:metal-binding protein [Candidatus Lokiarchaeota archaeon]